MLLARSNGEIQRLPRNRADSWRSLGIANRSIDWSSQSPESRSLNESERWPEVPVCGAVEKKREEDEDAERGWNGQREGQKEREKERERQQKSERRNSSFTVFLWRCRVSWFISEKGFPFCWSWYHCEMLPVRFYIAVCAAFSTISRLFEATTLSDVGEISMIARSAGRMSCAVPFKIVVIVSPNRKNDVY